LIPLRFLDRPAVDLKHHALALEFNIGDLHALSGSRHWTALHDLHVEIAVAGDQLAVALDR